MNNLVKACGIYDLHVETGLFRNIKDSSRKIITNRHVLSCAFVDTRTCHTALALFAPGRFD